MTNSNTPDEWKQKYEDSEKKFNYLMQLSHKALLEYDELKEKYKENVLVYGEVRKRLEQRENEMIQIQTVLGPALDEIRRLEHQYEMQTALMQAAEGYASKLHEKNSELDRNNQKLKEKNKRLTRASMMLRGKLQTFEFKFDEFDDSETTDSEKEDETGESTNNNVLDTYHLTKIRKLEDEINNLKQDLEKSERTRGALMNRDKLLSDRIADLEIELQEKNEKLKEFDDVEKEIKRVSMIVAEKFDEIQNEVEKEKHLRIAAENEASKIHRDYARQSQAIISSPDADHNLKLEIGRLENDIAVQKESFEAEIASLRSKVDDSRELRLSRARSNTLEKELDELRKHTENVNHENKVLKEELERARKPNIPPPPPLPPLAPKSGGFLKNLIGMGKKPDQNTCKTKAAPKKQGNEAFDGALKEMMARIQRGEALKTSGRMEELVTEKTEAKEAIGELENMLRKINKREPTIPKSIKEEPEPEFMQIRRKMSLKKIEEEENKEKNATYI